MTSEEASLDTINLCQINKNGDYSNLLCMEQEKYKESEMKTKTICQNTNEKKIDSRKCPLTSLSEKTDLKIFYDNAIDCNEIPKNTITTQNIDQRKCQSIDPIAPKTINDIKEYAYFLHTNNSELKEVDNSEIKCVIDSSKLEFEGAANNSEFKFAADSNDSELKDVDNCGLKSAINNLEHGLECIFDNSEQKVKAVHLILKVATADPHIKIATGNSGLGDDIKLELDNDDATDNFELNDVSSNLDVNNIANNFKLDGITDNLKIDSVDNFKLYGELNNPEPENIISYPELKDAADKSELDCTIDEPKLENDANKPVLDGAIDNNELNDVVDKSELDCSIDTPKQENAAEESALEGTINSERKDAADNFQVNNLDAVDQEILTKDESKDIKDYLEDEKDDLINPEWDAIKDLTTNEERYQQVRKCWGSKKIPDPNKNLTYHSYRKRLFDFGHSEPRTVMQCKRQATTNLSGRSAKRPCTFFIDREINIIERIKENEKQAIMNEMHNRICSISEQCQQREIELQRWYNPYEYESRLRKDRVHHEINARVSVITDEYKKIVDECEYSFRDKIGTLHERRDEVLKFYRFYEGLNVSDEDPTHLTEVQFRELDEIETVYKQFDNYYK